MTCAAAEGLCYIKNDAPTPFKGHVVLNTTAYATGVIVTLLDRPVSLPAGAGAIEWFDVPAVAALDGTTHALEAIAVASASQTRTRGAAQMRREVPHKTESRKARGPLGSRTPTPATVPVPATVPAHDENEVVSRNFVALATPGNMRLLPSNITVTATRVGTAGGSHSFVADVRCSTVAVFVTLTTLAHGRFQDNAFLLRPPGRKVAFELASPYPARDPASSHPIGGVGDEAWAAFSASLRVEDASAYM